MLSIKNKLANTTSQMFQVGSEKRGNRVATKALFCSVLIQIKIDVLCVKQIAVDCCDVYACGKVVSF